jgi:hypothetical protein
MPLLMLVYFQTDAIQQIEDNIRSVLAMQVPIRKWIKSDMIWKKEKNLTCAFVIIAKLGLFEIQKLFRSLKTNAI